MKEELLEKIRKHGYWRVVIRPGEYKKTRINSLEECEKLIKDNQVRLRGWDYPHVDSQEGIFRSSTSSVASFSNWPEGGKIEYWELDQSAQFTHYFCIREDLEIKNEKIMEIKREFRLSDPVRLGDRFFEIINGLYSFTEIYLFASRIAEKVEYSDEIEISITLGNTSGRTLFFWNMFMRHLSMAYTCKFEPIEMTKQYKTDDLISQYKEFSLDVAIETFKYFNWKDANAGVFIEDQKKFIEKRF
ncbi:hypothetical protein KKB10_00455 [Patescibacteria group bacterium]|nr:hypothetical protein [Patescibacteria group bacterium]MBU2229208.1 hypothetical protein [Patescibacteria group bacterium]